MPFLLLLSLPAPRLLHLCSAAGQYTALAQNRQHDVTVGAAICDKFQAVHYATQGAVGGELRPCRQCHSVRWCADFVRTWQIVRHSHSCDRP